MNFNKLYHVIPLRVFLQTKNKLSWYVRNTPFDKNAPSTYLPDLFEFLRTHLSKNVLLQSEYVHVVVDFLGREDFDYIHICFQSDCQQFYPDNPASLVKEQEIIKLAFIRELEVEESFLHYQIPVLSLKDFALREDSDDGFAGDWYE